MKIACVSKWWSIITLVEHEWMIEGNETILEKRINQKIFIIQIRFLFLS